MTVAGFAVLLCILATVVATRTSTGDATFRTIHHDRQVPGTPGEIEVRSVPDFRKM